MTTPVERALERVEDERGRVREHRRGVERFERELRQLSPVSARGQQQASKATAGGTVAATEPVGGGARGRDRCARVRDLFADHVQPQAGLDDEPLLAVIREELGDRVALVLAPPTDTSFTDAVKSELLSATDQRQTKLDAMARGLAAESQSLEWMADETAAIAARLEPTEQSLLSLGFTELRTRHDSLTTCRDRLERLHQSRQQHLQGASGADGVVGLTHHSLVDYLYDQFPSRYPVLSTLAGLSEYCLERQRAVRDHLTRRV